MTAAAPPAAVPQLRPTIGPIRGYVDFYLTAMRIAVSTQFQYRVSNYFFMTGMVAEPVIYLVVWSTIAVQQGGQIGGITPGEFAAYFIVWTLVRNMNAVQVDIRVPDRGARRPAPRHRVARWTRDAAPLDRDRRDRDPACLADCGSAIGCGERLT
jgi:hypothetical protein